MHVRGLRILRSRDFYVLAPAVQTIEGHIFVVRVVTTQALAPRPVWPTFQSLVYSALAGACLGVLLNLWDGFWSDTLTSIAATNPCLLLAPPPQLLC